MKLSDIPTRIPGHKWHFGFGLGRVLSARTRPEINTKQKQTETQPAIAAAEKQAVPKAHSHQTPEHEIAQVPAVPKKSTQVITGINKDPKKTKEAIEVIERPAGEAGDGKRGFCLQEAVDYDQNNDEFAEFLVSHMFDWRSLPALFFFFLLIITFKSRVRSNAELARVDITKTYRQQDPEVISLVCRKVCNQFLLNLHSLTIS